jgi:hypothetical protein
MHSKRLGQWENFKDKNEEDYLRYFEKSLWSQELIIRVVPVQD